MSAASKIEWTEQTWNPVVGCSLVSPGCTNCYAMKQAARIERMSPSLEHYKGLTRKVNGKPVWTGKLALAPEKTLLEPLRRKKPTMYFVNSMGDLFHEDTPLEWLRWVWEVMVEAHGMNSHTFQVLTKRPENMARMLGPKGIGWYATEAPVPRPEPGIWLGVSCERQQEADERIPHLLATPAAVRFVSLEPLLGAIQLGAVALDQHRRVHCLTGDAYDWYGAKFAAPRRSRIDWVIVGGESGPGARPAHPDWFRRVRDDCQKAGVAFFFKQWGGWAPFGYYTKDGRRLVHLGVDDKSETIVTLADGAKINMKRVGKKAAGRLLDGRTWDEMPAIPLEPGTNRGEAA